MESIGKLATALAKAQSEIKGAKKDAENPFFKSKYADLASVWEACRDALSKNELAVAQVTDFGPNGEMVLNTVLMHSSGERMIGSMPIMVGDKATAQQVGSAITYARRYGLAAMVGVAPEDDDGNQASQTEAKTSFKKAAPKVDVEGLKTKATELVRKIELSETKDELSKILLQNMSLVAEVGSLLPDWSARLDARIKEQKEALGAA